MLKLRQYYNLWTREQRADGDSDIIREDMDRLFAQAASIYDRVIFPRPMLVDRQRIQAILDADQETPDWQAIRRASLQVYLPHPTHLQELQRIALPPCEMIGASITIDSSAAPLPFFICRYPSSIPTTVERNGKVKSVDIPLKKRTIFIGKVAFSGRQRGSELSSVGCSALVWHPDPRAFDDRRMVENEEITKQIELVPQPPPGPGVSLIFRQVVKQDLYNEQAHLYKSAETAIAILTMFQSSRILKITGSSLPYHP